MRIAMQLAVVATMVLVAAPTPVISQTGTAFTYQGELNDNGNLGNGSYNMDFSLWDAVTAGNQIGSTLSLTGVLVSNGKFSVEVDFGGDGFDNSDRWLEIVVNGTMLAPRTSITRSPYAIQTRGIHVSGDESFVGIGRTQPITLSEMFGLKRDTTSFAGMYVETSGGHPFYGYSSTGAADAYHYLDGLTGDWHLYTGGATRLSVRSDGFVGVGRSDPVTASEIFGIYKNTSSFGGMYVETAATGEPFYGYSAGGGVDAFHSYSGTTGDWYLSNGGAPRLTVASDGFVGIGRDTPIAGSEIFGLYKATLTFGGMYIETLSTGMPFYGYSAGGDIDAFHHFDGNNGSWHLNLGGTEVLKIESNGFTHLSSGAFLFADNINADEDMRVGGTITVFGNDTTSTPLEVHANSGGDSAEFLGDVSVFGFLSKVGGGFTIDHPLDPENKYLTHSFVESPDMMNIYNGNVVTDEEGFATVDLPEWFDALNRDFRYQLTVIGSFAQAIVSQEIEDNRFVIQTDVPGVKVSWQVTGVRDDAYARTQPYEVEAEKLEVERGRFLTPEAFGHGPERGIGQRSVPTALAEDK